jgi:AcrR family transcriptional regulator
MGIKERREREKNELRSRIMDAARELILEQGVEAVSMRKIADRIEYSPTAIYQHFADKEALLRAMCERDFDALGEDMRERTAHVPDPVERIMMLGEGYVRFAMEYPSHFRVMFMTPAAHPTTMTDEDRAKQNDPNQDGYAYLKVAVQAGIDGGHFRPELTDVELIAQTFWAAVHGVAAIQVAKADDPWIKFAPLEQRVRLAVDSILRGMLREPEQVNRIHARRTARAAEVRS